MTSDIQPISRAAQTVNGGIVIYGTRTLSHTISESLASQRFAMALLGAFAGLATILASIGIYGVISYIAGQRTHEIGIRMALGAKQGDVLRMMLAQAGKMALIGVAIGLLVGVGLMRLMGTLLFGISTHDPITFTTVAVLLTLVALAACYLPARRASSIDPMVALREE